MVFKVFLNAYWLNDYSFYSEDDVANTIACIKDYYSTVSYDRCFKSKYNMSIACGNVLTQDGFNIKPFMIIMEPDVAKDYLVRAVNIEGSIDYLDYYDYESLDSLIIDDGVHQVYLTSQCGHDSNYDFQNYGYSGIYNGYYYDGHSYIHGLFSVNDNISSDIYDIICLSMNEFKFVENNLKDLDDLGEIKYCIDERLSDVDDEFTYSKDKDIIASFYSDYYRCRCIELSNVIEYPEITDSQLQEGSKSYDFNNCDKDSDGYDVDF